MNRISLLVLLVGVLNVPPLLAAPGTGVITVAEQPARLIRATTLYDAAAGTRLQGSDYLASGSAGVLLDQLAGTRVALGPGTRIYLERKGNATRIALLEGWLKLQPLKGARPSRLLLSTAGLELDASQAAGVIHADASGTEVFVEDGKVSVLEARHDNRKTELTREEYAQFKGQAAPAAIGRPSSEFIRAMPAAFFDPLPAVATGKGAGDPLDKVREVSFADVSPLLLGPVKLDSRALALRFSPRLSDPAFRQAIVQRFGGTLPWEAELYRFERKGATR
ncbi:hypothetical protein ACQKPE_03490 [Pseudomonas sp. NPDC089554]|uniref:hypothetical protein n=1 Tax=Pseudomonas sp. NPDC089554 TaxID=3390653 RepID=UPI003D02A3A6